MLAETCGLVFLFFLAIGRCFIPVRVTAPRVREGGTQFLVRDPASYAQTARYQAARKLPDKSHEPVFGTRRACTRACVFVLTQLPCVLCRALLRQGWTCTWN